MDEQTLQSILQRLDMAVWESMQEGSFRLLTPRPDWLLHFNLDDGETLVDCFPYLETFLEDAENCWDVAGATLTSSPWIEVNTTGEPIALEAQTMCVEGQRLLLISNLGDRFEHRQQLLQTARENLLLKENLRRLHDQKNRFLGMAAHDLRNPLTAIMGFSKLLVDEVTDPLTEQQKRLLNTIRQSSQQMLILINDLLDVSSIENGSFELDKAVGDLNALVTERILLQSISADKKGITIDAGLHQTKPLSFDSNRIAQVVDNLLGNAIKFSPRKGSVNVRTEESDDHVSILVSDEGPGILEEELPKLFRPFQRLSAKTTGKEKSTGLGLSIVKNIVDSHEGSIAVENNLDGGCTFIVRLPA